MSIRTRLVRAFLLVALVALILSFLGLNVGMYVTMVRLHGGGMMAHGQPMMGEAGGFMAATFRWSLWSSLAALTLAALTGYWTAGRIARPVRHLRDAAGLLDLRDLSKRVPVESEDEIGELARTFNRMCDRLEAEDRSRRQLLADTAHELRHPLAVMQGHLDLLLDGKEEPSVEAILPLQDEVTRLTRLVGDLRDLSLAEVGQLSLRMCPVDVGEQVERLMMNLEPVAQAKEIQLVAEVAEGLPIISGDPDRIRQVILNLLTNALQYTPSGGQVIIGVSEAAGEVRVQVVDTGPGIDPENLPHVFDRFYRGDKSRARGTGGSGLGLAIVRSITELHGGRVEVQSSRGSGTSFVVHLPAKT